MTQTETCKFLAQKEIEKSFAAFEYLKITDPTSRTRNSNSKQLSAQPQ